MNQKPKGVSSLERLRPFSGLTWMIHYCICLFSSIFIEAKYLNVLFWRKLAIFIVGAQIPLWVPTGILWVPRHPQRDRKSHPWRLDTDTGRGGVGCGPTPCQKGGGRPVTQSVASYSRPVAGFKHHSFENAERRWAFLPGWICPLRQRNQEHGISEVDIIPYLWRWAARSLCSPL